MDPERGYTVHDREDVRVKGPGGTDRDKRRMVSPFTISGAMVARHELGHATWSPKKEKSRKKKILLACIRAVEDARVNEGLRHLGMPVVFPRAQSERYQEHFSVHANNVDVTQLVIRAISGCGSNLESRYAKVLRSLYKSHENTLVPWVAGMIAQTHKKMKRARGDNAVFSHEQGVRIARWLAKNIERNDPNAESSAMKAINAVGGMITQCIELPPGAEKGSSQGHPMYSYGNFNKTGSAQKYTKKMGQFYGHDWKGTSPGEMEIHEPPRHINVIPPKLEKVRKHSVSDEGTEFWRIERFVTDQMVFRRKRKKRQGGGSVLVDVSGSMALDTDDINRIVEGSPEATLIAIYSGDGAVGQLRIVVADGKRSDEVSPYGISNVIDVPALEWLSFQPAPRVWMSDGGVTGINDRGSQRINNACATLCADHNITRCGGVDAVVDVLIGKDHKADRSRNGL
jgi:hypothetical protein